MSANRNEKEIYDQLDQANSNIDEGTSAFSGMTYEEGVKAALEWILNKDSDAPMDEDA